MITEARSIHNLLVGMLADPSILIEHLVTGINQDSRDANGGDLFLLLAKDMQQRIGHLKQVIDADVAIILFEQSQPLTQQEIVLLKHTHIMAYPIKQLAMKGSEIAARFYGHPSLALTVIAVTGTNGKTSVSQFIAQALEGLELPCGVMGTLGAGRIGSLFSTGMTTPDPISVQRILADFCQQGLKYAVIEASSHALVQGRLESVAIDVAVLTNISRDHLDYHRTMEAYSLAKQHLFELPSVKTVVINRADDLGQALIEILVDKTHVETISYSSEVEHHDSVTLGATECELTQAGLNFKINNSSIYSQVLGLFNIDNLLASMGSLIAVGISAEQAIESINQCHAVTGRMQLIVSNEYANVVVDFAHTPDALKQALTSLREHQSSAGNLWCIFGCGGDRDSGKRAEMGQIAELNATRLVVTDDNPRSESPQTIVNDILSGMKTPKKVMIEHDRRLAINYAITHAHHDDIILVAGKGHENYQEIQGVKYPLSDIEIVNDLFSMNCGLHHTSIGVQ